MNLNISVGYGEDLDRVMAVIDRVGRELAEDEYYGKLIKTPPKSRSFFGIRTTHKTFGFRLRPLG